MSVFNLFKGFTFNHSDVSGNRLDRPAAETKTLLDSRGKELMEFINKILTILNSPEGADFINTKDLNGNQVSIANILDELMNGGLANNAEVKKLKEIFESLIINAGNSNAEIVAARKNYPTVGDRLDGFDSSFEEETNNLKNKLLDLAKKDNDDINAKTLKVNGNNVYHVGYKPTPSDIGATPESNKELKFFGNVKSGTVVFDKSKLKNGVKISFLTSNKIGTDKWLYSINGNYVSGWNMSEEAKYVFDFTKIKPDGSMWMYETIIANPYRKTTNENRYDGGAYLHTGELNSITAYIDGSTNVCENLTALIEYY